MRRLSLKTALFTWTNVGSAQTPAARADALMIPGPCVDFVSLVGGRGAFRTGWTTGGYDPDSHALLVFGGYRLGPDQGPDTPGSQLFGPTNYTNDLWSLDLDTFTWTELHPQGASPSNRDNAASFFDASRGRLVTFGGEQFDALANDLWSYSVAGNRWTQVTFPPGAAIPPGRTGGVSFVRETGSPASSTSTAAAPAKAAASCSTICGS